MGARLEASTPQREAPDIAVALTRPSPLHHTHPTSPRIGHPPSAICHPPSAIRHPPFAICNPHICHPPFPVPHSAFSGASPQENQNHGQISNIFSGDIGMMYPSHLSYRGAQIMKR